MIWLKDWITPETKEWIQELYQSNLELFKLVKSTRILIKFQTKKRWSALRDRHEGAKSYWASWASLLQHKKFKRIQPLKTAAKVSLQDALLLIEAPNLGIIPNLKIQIDIKGDLLHRGVHSKFLRACTETISSERNNRRFFRKGTWVRKDREARLQKSQIDQIF